MKETGFQGLSDEEWLKFLRRETQKVTAFRSRIAALPPWVPWNHFRYYEVREHYRLAGEELKEMERRYAELRKALPIVEANVARRKGDLRTIAAGREMVVLEETGGEMALAELKQMRLFKRMLTIRSGLIKLLADMEKSIDYAQARLGGAGGMGLPLTAQVGNEAGSVLPRPFPPASSISPSTAGRIGDPPGRIG